MHRTSMFHAKLDYARSHGAYLYDANRGTELLDLFGLYASLPLGYNHPVFSEPEFRREILEAVVVKVPNCEMATEAADRFAAAFSGHPSMRPFGYFHFACTGALALEAALKTACDYRRSRQPRLIAFRESFHGINAYGPWITDRFGSVRARLDGFPGPQDSHLPNPLVRSGQSSAGPLAETVLQQIDDRIRLDRDRNIVAVLVEPIQCTAGDLVMDPQFLRSVRELCTRHDIPLIFDEVQTGFGSTGTMWYFEQIGIEPDIVAFGKKAQASGIMVKASFGCIFEHAARLEVTWDGDVIDMIRARHILAAYERFSVLENVRTQGAKMAAGLRALGAFEDVRQNGLLLAMDFVEPGQRDAFVREMLAQNAIVTSTQARTVRFRPHLAFTDDEAADALRRTAEAVERSSVAARDRRVSHARGVQS